MTQLTRTCPNYADCMFDTIDNCYEQSLHAFNDSPATQAQHTSNLLWLAVLYIKIPTVYFVDELSFLRTMVTDD